MQISRIEAWDKLVISARTSLECLTLYKHCPTEANRDSLLLAWKDIFTKEMDSQLSLQEAVTLFKFRPPLDSCTLWSKAKMYILYLQEASRVNEQTNINQLALLYNFAFTNGIRDIYSDKVEVLLKVQICLAFNRTARLLKGSFPKTSYLATLFEKVKFQKKLNNDFFPGTRQPGGKRLGKKFAM